MVKKTGIFALLIGIVGVVLMLGFSETASARMYKWKDEAGTHYTDDYYAVPPKYRPTGEPKPQSTDPLLIPFPTMNDEAEDPEESVEETDVGEQGDELKAEKDEPGLSDEAKRIINQAIVFLEKDAERYKSFYSLKSSRRNTKRLKETLLGTISERQRLAKNLGAIDTEAAKGVMGFLQSSISRDEELKGKTGRAGLGSGRRYKLMINPVKAEEKNKIEMANNLKQFLQDEDKKAKEAEEKKAKEEANKKANASDK
jgi:hypothetical protein